MDPRLLLVLLEEPFAEYKGAATLREVLFAGLSSPSEYWVGLAVGWLEEGLELDQEIVEMLNRIAEKRHFPQRLRHRSAALAKRWIREGA
jgi:hypothetical protein